MPGGAWQERFAGRGLFAVFLLCFSSRGSALRGGFLSQRWERNQRIAGGRLRMGALCAHIRLSPGPLITRTALCRESSHPARGACVLACPSIGPPALLRLFGKAFASPPLRLRAAPFAELLAFGGAFCLPPSGEGVPEGQKGGEKTRKQKKSALRPNFHIMYETVSHLWNFLPI